MQLFHFVFSFTPCAGVCPLLVRMFLASVAHSPSCWAPRHRSTARGRMDWSLCQRLPRSFIRIAFLHPWQVNSPFHPASFTQFCCRFLLQLLQVAATFLDHVLGFFAEDVQSQPGRQMLWIKTPLVFIGICGW
eukprot:Gb_18976 [translate_table: standard]